MPRPVVSLRTAEADTGMAADFRRITTSPMAFPMVGGGRAMKWDPIMEAAAMPVVTPAMPTIRQRSATECPGFQRGGTEAAATRVAAAVDMAVAAADMGAAEADMGAAEAHAEGSRYPSATHPTRNALPRPISKLNNRSLPNRNTRPPRGNSRLIAGSLTSSPPV